MTGQSNCPSFVLDNEALSPAWFSFAATAEMGHTMNTLFTSDTVTAQESPENHVFVTFMQMSNTNHYSL